MEPTKAPVTEPTTAPVEQSTTAPQPTEAAAAEPTTAPSTGGGVKPIKLGFLAGVQDPFYFTMQRGAEQAAADLGIELVTQIPQHWNTTDQTPMLDAMVARGDLDLIFMAPVDKEAMIAPMQKANDAGIPLITVDTFIGDGDYTSGPVTFPLSFIASDYKEGGVIACSCTVPGRTILSAKKTSTLSRLPRLDELLFMLRREKFDEISQAGGEAGDWLLANPLGLSDLGQELLDRGVKMALIKLGCAGLYLRTAGREVLDELAGSRFSQPAAWANRELRAPCFQVNVVGTTGSGDATIAGFLSALLRGLSPEDALYFGSGGGSLQCGSGRRPGWCAFVGGRTAAHRALLAASALPAGARALAQAASARSLAKSVGCSLPELIAVSSYPSRPQRACFFSFHQNRL